MWERGEKRRENVGEEGEESQKYVKLFLQKKISREKNNLYTLLAKSV